MLTLCLTAAAWDSLDATWPDDAFPLPYAIASDLGSLEDDATIVAIQAAFETWSSVDCAAISFTYTGRVDASFGAADGQNVVFFLEDTWPDEASLVSSPAIISAGTTITEADMALNGVYYGWSVDGDGRTTMDVQAAVTHELGHWLGLWHSSVAEASLNPAMDGNPEARTLEQDDLDGLCALYQSGAGALGDPCAAPEDCADGYVCISDGGSQYCSVECDKDACPADYACIDAGGQAVCALETDAGCGCNQGGAPAGWLVIGLAWTLRRSRGVASTPAAWVKSAYSNA